MGGGAVERRGDLVWDSDPQGRESAVRYGGEYVLRWWGTEAEHAEVVDAEAEGGGEEGGECGGGDPADNGSGLR